MPVLLVLFFGVTDCHAQWIRQRSVFIDFSLNLQNEGTFTFTGLSYDFRLKPEAFEGLGLKAGASYGATQWIVGTDSGTYRAISLLGGANWLIMPEKNGLEIGLYSRLYLYPGNMPTDALVKPVSLMHRRFGALMMPSLAYRFQPYHYGLSFRVEYTPYIGFQNNSWVGFGVSVGYLLF